MRATSDELIAGIVRAREAARVCVDQAADVAVELVALDGELRAARDTLQRAQLANALRYAAAASDVAEQRAVRALFELRLQERVVEDAHARIVRAQLEDLDRARMLAAAP